MDEPTSEQRRELDRLVGSLCDGLLADTKWTQLDEFLHDHAWARSFYLSRIDLHGRLSWDCGFPSPVGAPSRATVQGVRARNEAASGEALTPRSECVAHEERGVTRAIGLSRPEAEGGWLAAARAFLGQFRQSWALTAAIVGSALLVTAAISLRPRDDSSPITATTPSSRENFVAVQATFTRTANLQWDSPMTAPWLGSRPGTHLMKIRGGRVQITFDNGIEVIVQGPAEFSHDGFGGMALNYGMLAAKLPAHVREFTVLTTSAQVIGGRTSTFGLTVEPTGQTELHVTEGAVSAGLLTDAVRGAEKHPLYTITANSAIRLDRESESVTTIPCDSYLFAEINNQQLDVVDLVAGGDGYGDRLAYGLDALSGKKLLPHEFPLAYVASDAKYHTVDGNPFIDGVFVPPDALEPIQLDSSGNRFAGFPPLSGKVWQGGVALHRSGHEQPVSKAGTGEVLNWLQSRDPKAFAGMSGAFLGMHANCGMTLDLQQIATIVRDGRLARFHASLLHLRPERPGGEVARPPVLWVFLDGKLHASFRPSGDRMPVEVDMPLSPGYRFLTIVSTDGDGAIDEDWIVLVNPTLKWVANISDSI